jgi:hypothetical protein
VCGGSGAGYAPAQGGMAGVNQGNLNQAAQMQALGGILQGAGSLYNASSMGSTGSSYTMSDPNTHYGTTGMSAEQLGSYVPF